MPPDTPKGGPPNGRPSEPEKYALSVPGRGDKARGITAAHRSDAGQALVGALLPRQNGHAEEPSWLPDATPDATPDAPPDAPPDAQENSHRVILTPASAIRPRRVRWLWDGRVAVGSLSLLAGGEGLGKSTLIYTIAADVTRGKLPGEYHGKPRAVLVCASEDSWEYTIVPRLMAARADLDLVFRVEVRTADEITVGLSLPRDLVQVEAAAVEVGAVLLVLDPLISRLAEGIDTHKDAEVRRALEPMTALADRAGMAIVGLIHHNKSGSTDPLQLVMASKAFTAVARSVHTVVKDPDDDTETRRLFGTPKNNLGRTDLPTLAFAIVSYPIETDEGVTTTGRLTWVGEVEGSISDAMRRAATNDDDRAASNEAADWLTDYLTSQGGTAESATIKREGAKAGHSQDALKRARRKIKAKVSSQGFPRRTFWTLTLSDKDSSAPVGAAVGAAPRGDAPTAPTAPTEALPLQSVQSVQSEQSAGDVPDCAPTGAPDHPADYASWPPSESGPCARCGAVCHRYGDGSNPLCSDCRNP